MSGAKRLSVCMITKNDEQCLSSCLQGIQGAVDEVIIADLGSSDCTVSMGRQAGAQVYQIKWANNYSQAQNICLDHAAGRWVLFLRADEVLAPGWLTKIDMLLENPTVEGYLLYIDSYSERHHITSPVQCLRLFRNRKQYRFQYRSFPRIPDERISNIKDAGIRIVRQGGFASYRELASPASLLQEEWAEAPDDAYLQYLYGIELLNRQKYEESVRCFQNALKAVNLDYLFAPHLYKCLSWALMSEQRDAEALDTLNEGIEYFSYYLDLRVLRGELHKKHRRYNEALDDLQSSLKIREQANDTVPRPEINLSTILETLGETHEQVFNYRQALDCYRQAFEANPGDRQLQRKIDQLVEKKNKFAELVQQLHNEPRAAACEPMPTGTSEPSGGLEYVLWSKSCFGKLEQWLERVCRENSSAGVNGEKILQVPAKPSEALLSFYQSMSGANISEHSDGELTCKDIHWQMGLHYEHEDKKGEALAAYLRALQWAPLDNCLQTKIRDWCQEQPREFHIFLEGKQWTLEGSCFAHKQEFVDYVTGLISFKNQEFTQASASFAKIGQHDTSYPLARAYIISGHRLAEKEAETERRLNENKYSGEVVSACFRICQNYIQDRLNEGLKQYPYSELIKAEKERVEKTEHGDGSFAPFFT